MKVLPYILLLGLIGCGSGTPLPFASLAGRQPTVLEVLPADGTLNYENGNVEVLLSEPIDPASLSSQSFFLTPLPDGEGVREDIVADVRKKVLKPMEGEYEIIEDGRRLRFLPRSDYPEGIQLGVFVTSDLFSVDRVPFSQTPGEGATPFFSSFYTAGERGETLSEGDVSSGPSVPPPSFLRLNEVFYDAEGGDGEGNLFVELLGEADRNLGGYQIYFIRGSDGNIMQTLVIPDGLQTDPDGFFVVADAVTGNPGMTHVIGADWVKNFDPPNGPDCVQLLDPAGNLVDALGYGAPLVLRAENNRLCFETLSAPDAPAGFSLSRRAEEEDTDNNADDWKINFQPSPGGPETEFEEDAGQEE